MLMLMITILPSRHTVCCICISSSSCPVAQWRGRLRELKQRLVLLTLRSSTTPGFRSELPPCEATEGGWAGHWIARHLRAQQPALLSITGRTCQRA
jgi:hypothetical protein